MAWSKRGKAIDVSIENVLYIYYTIFMLLMLYILNDIGYRM